MKHLRFWLFALTLNFFCSTTYIAQQPEPLRSDWLDEDFKSIELISLLGSPTPLTVQGIRDILRVEDSGEEDRDIGFDATTFEIQRGNGYTTLYLKGLVFKGNIGMYRIEILATSETWPRIRERVIDLWKHNRGPDFIESDTGIVHSENSEAVLSNYRSAVSASLGQMKTAEIPDELKKPFDYLTSPEHCTAIGREAEIAIEALANANRVDLIESVLRGFSPSGRVCAARELLKLQKTKQLVLSSDTVSTIEKVRNLDILICTVSGCIVNYVTADAILSEADDENEKPSEL